MREINEAFDNNDSKRGFSLVNKFIRNKFKKPLIQAITSKDNQTCI